MPPTTIKPRNILIFGATGTIGTYILNSLITGKSHFNRLAIFTSPSTVENKADTIADLKARGVEVIVGDVRSEEDVWGAYKDIDTIISAVGRPVLADQITLLKLAARSPSVTWFFPSEYGTDIEYSPASATEPTHQVKLQVRAAIREIVDAAPTGGDGDAVGRLNYTYLVTGPYAEMYMGPGHAGLEGGGFDVVRREARVLGDGGGRVSLTAMGDVGTLLLSALLHPSTSLNRALKVNSFTTTPLAILAEFERQTTTTDDNNKWTVSFTPLPNLRRLEKEAWESGAPNATVLTLRRIWTEGGTLYERRDNGDIGEPGVEGLEGVVRRVVRVQRGDGK
ncbi:hypothetical protein FQN55_007164 [Onygenales sp. PD_40]|nr:hypothetical protein FQN55_007164 [Onygenales sp. PD_40]KAK2780785.1 hypothetical protein FQN52_002046 [Onygenales sp. PD_12]